MVAARAQACRQRAGSPRLPLRALLAPPPSGSGGSAPAWRPRPPTLYRSRPQGQEPPPLLQSMQSVRSHGMHIAPHAGGTCSVGTNRGRCFCFLILIWWAYRAHASQALVASVGAAQAATSAQGPTARRACYPALPALPSPPLAAAPFPRRRLLGYAASAAMVVHGQRYRQRQRPTVDLQHPAHHHHHHR